MKPTCDGYVNDWRNEGEIGRLQSVALSCSVNVAGYTGTVGARKMSAGGAAPASDPSSEGQLTAELEQTPFENLRRPCPPIAIGVDDAQDGAGVQHVVRIEIRLDARPRTDPEDLGQSQVDCVRRSSNSVCGLLNGTVAVAVHTTRVPQAARLRPNDGAISVVDTA